MNRTLNLGGGGGGGVIAGSETVYTSTPDDVTGLAGDNAFANRLTGIDGGESLNDGEFTVTTVSSVDRIVIPEDGNYQITCASRVNLTNNDTLGTARCRFTSRIRRGRSGVSDLTLGSGGDVYIRHQYLGTFASGSTEAEAVVALEEDDEIWFEYSTNQQTTPRPQTSKRKSTSIGWLPLAPEAPRAQRATLARRAPMAMMALRAFKEFRENRGSKAKRETRGMMERMGLAARALPTCLPLAPPTP